MVDFGDDPEFWAKACAVVIPYMLLYGFVAWRAHARGRHITAGSPTPHGTRSWQAPAPRKTTGWRLTY